MKRQNIAGIKGLPVFSVGVFYIFVIAGFLKKKRYIEMSLNNDS